MPQPGRSHVARGRTDLCLNAAPGRRHAAIEVLYFFRLPQTTIKSSLSFTAFTPLRGGPSLERCMQNQSLQSGHDSCARTRSRKIKSRRRTGETLALPWPASPPDRDPTLYLRNVAAPYAYPTHRFLNWTERVSPAAATLTRPRLCRLAASSRVGLSTSRNRALLAHQCAPCGAFGRQCVTP